MKKLLLLSLSLMLHANQIYFDNKPSEIANDDLTTMKEFDNLAYKIAERVEEEPISIKHVFSYMIRNQEKIDDYTKMKVSATTEVGRRTARSTGTGTEDSNIFPSDFNYYKAGIELRYDFYDPKTEKDIHNQKLEYRSKLLSMIQKYASAKESVTQLTKQLEYNRLIQIRLKIMTKTAQKYLDDRLKGISDILDINNKLNDKKIDLEYLKLDLLNLVIASAKSGLEDLL